MGEAADGKLREIAATRSRIEDDLRELESRLPGPLRSGRAAVGAAIGGSMVVSSLGWLVHRRRRRRSAEARTARVLVSVVRGDDASAGT